MCDYIFAYKALYIIILTLCYKPKHYMYYDINVFCQLQNAQLQWRYRNKNYNSYIAKCLKHYGKPSYTFNALHRKIKKCLMPHTTLKWNSLEAIAFLHPGTPNPVNNIFSIYLWVLRLFDLFKVVSYRELVILANIMIRNTLSIWQCVNKWSCVQIPIHVRVDMIIMTQSC